MSHHDSCPILPCPNTVEEKRKLAICDRIKEVMDTANINQSNSQAEILKSTYGLNSFSRSSAMIVEEILTTLEKASAKWSEFLISQVIVLINHTEDSHILQLYSSKTSLLHYILRSPVLFEVRLVYYLMQKFPSLISLCDRDGDNMNILHILLSREEIYFGLVFLAIQLNPSAIRQKTGNGKAPLQTMISVMEANYCEEALSFAIVSEMLRVDPSVIFQTATEEYNKLVVAYDTPNEQGNATSGFQWVRHFEEWTVFDRVQEWNNEKMQLLFRHFASKVATHRKQSEYFPPEHRLQRGLY